MKTTYDIGDLVYVYEGSLTTFKRKPVEGINITKKGEEYFIGENVKMFDKRDVYRHKCKLIERLKDDVRALYEERIAMLEEERKRGEE